MLYENIKEYWQQGDIIVDCRSNYISSDLAVLFSPQCDIINNKIENYLLVLSTDFRNAFRQIVDSKNKLTEDYFNGTQELSKSKLKEIISRISNYLHGSSSYRFYYLPYFSSFDKYVPTFLDFQKLTTIPRDYLLSISGKRVFRIRDPFRSQLISRYSSYMGRIGTPDYDTEEIYKMLNLTGLSFRDEDFEDIFK